MTDTRRAASHLATKVIRLLDVALHCTQPSESKTTLNAASSDRN